MRVHLTGVNQIQMHTNVYTAKLLWKEELPPHRILSLGIPLCQYPDNVGVPHTTHNRTRCAANLLAYSHNCTRRGTGIVRIETRTHNARQSACSQTQAKQQRYNNKQQQNIYQSRKPCFAAKNSVSLHWTLIAASAWVRNFLSPSVGISCNWSGSGDFVWDMRIKAAIMSRRGQ